VKAYKILLFILLVIAALGVVCYFFPPQGITVGKFQLRFARLDNVLAGQEPQLPEVTVEEETIDYEYLAECKDFEDSIHKIEVALVEKEGIFYFPNNDLTYFDRMFAEMEQAQSRGQVVRVLHYGDSQIEMDRISAQLRSFFQSNFGGGGPGMLPLVQSVPSSAVNQSASGSFTKYSTYGDGIMATSFHLNGSAVFYANATKQSSTDPRIRKFSDIKLLCHNRSGNFSAILKDRIHQTTDTCSTDQCGISCLQWKLDSSTTSLQISMQGNTDIYGIMLDNGPGIAVDNIPMRGSSGDVFTKITDTLLTTCYRQSHVGLIILQYGGNTVPSLYSEKSVEAYCNNLQQQIRYIQRCCPSATLLFIGPSDMSTVKNGQLQTYPLLPLLVEKIKETALANGVAYWDIYEVMGGQNSMIAWEQKGLAGPDYIHFTPAGARKVAKILTNNFEMMYEHYKMKKGAPQPKN